MKTPQNRFIYRGDSMVPTLINGDLLICRSVQHDRIVPGDIIVFSRPSSPELIVHRVIGKTACGFYTRGDNVPVSDPGLVAPHRISGVCGHVERKRKNHPRFQRLGRHASCPLPALAKQALYGGSRRYPPALSQPVPQCDQERLQGPSDQNRDRILSAA